MAKLLTITKTEYQMVDNAKCERCDVSIDDTENINHPGYLFWCVVCAEENKEALEAVLKEIDPKCKSLPTTYRYKMAEEEKPYRYYWWVGGEYTKKIRAIPKKEEDLLDEIIKERTKNNPEFPKMVDRAMIDRLKSLASSPVGQHALIKLAAHFTPITPDPIVMINEEKRFVVKWSDGSQEEYVDGRKQ
jgi:hypothetical protein